MYSLLSLSFYPHSLSLSLLSPLSLSPSLSLSAMAAASVLHFSISTRPKYLIKWCDVDNIRNNLSNPPGLIFGMQMWKMTCKGSISYGPSKKTMMHFISSWRPLSTLSLAPHCIYDRNVCSSTIAHGLTMVKDDSHKLDFNCIDMLIQIVHGFAESFFLAIGKHETLNNGPQLSKAWVGVDVNAWQKCVSYQVAVYSLLQAVIKLVIVDDGNGVPDPVHEMLMDLLHSFVLLENVHQLAFEAGVEQEFLEHFGSKILYYEPNKEVTFPNKEVIFWMELVRTKLSTAFLRESVIASLESSSKTKVLDGDLAALGLFALLGRKTRYFLSSRGIKDLDEPVKDFLSCMECGILFVYPEMSSLPLYQLFMEVVTEEVGWLDFYGAVPGVVHQERKKSIQAKKEIILSTVFNVCSGWFSSYAYYRKTMQQSLDTKVANFFMQSQDLLSTCLDDYWAAYDRTCYQPESSAVFPELLSTSRDEILDYEPMSGEEKVSQRMEVPLMKGLTAYSYPQCKSQFSKSTISDGTEPVTLERLARVQKTIPVRESMMRKTGKKMISASIDIWMGTRLLFADVSAAFALLIQKICGRDLTNRDRKKLTRTLIDIATAIPVTILMLLPVSAVGHAAILAAIKKYIPSLIPSPYSSERLDLVKQLKRIQKMGDKPKDGTMITARSNKANEGSPHQDVLKPPCTLTKGQPIK
ncbi:uncharacterized protein LOC18443351 isoform X5 [Amborella trichopoda]|uniref:uncharacterized protein LOC18443351 isoform X5 n=1 Tax=Amborella trichopoda TaxID=13333 RepID=UPI0009BF45CB|nr:uncharacterized protein LOC18443351 isoform X5 [Amborella trichopoda]|eukprot:XP_020528609.1 uncharacterized protein LOC18443351 isoform X5 [Amborella trichopoda]